MRGPLLDRVPILRSTRQDVKRSGQIFSLDWAETYPLRSSRIAEGPKRFFPVVHEGISFLLG